MTTLVRSQLLQAVLILRYTIAVAKNIRKLGNSTIDIKKLTADISKLYQYILSGDDVSYEAIMEKAVDIAKSVEAQSKVVMEDVPEYKSALADVRNTVVHLSDAQKSEIEAVTGKKWNRALIGKVKFSENGTPLDIAFQELATKYPNFFDKSVSNAQQGLELIEGYNRLKDLSEIVA